jgi:hypothetical protein
MHGGKRAGAGRRPGGANTRTREIADKAAKAGITPLEIMLEAMRSSYDKGELAEAAKHAAVAAPYVHARLTDNKNTTRVIRSLEDLTNDEIDALAADRGGEE